MGGVISACYTGRDSGLWLQEININLLSLVLMQALYRNVQLPGLYL